MMCRSNTTKLYYVYYCTMQHVSILIESSSGPSKKTDPYLKCLKMRCGVPNAYIFYKTTYKMHVLFCSYCTIGIPISKPLTGTFERDYTDTSLYIYIYVKYFGMANIKYIHFVVVTRGLTDRVKLTFAFWQRFVQNVVRTGADTTWSVVVIW